MKSDWSFDTPLDKAIERAENRLKQLKTRDSEAIFHCPICGKDFEQLGNYRELKMCSKCYSKKSREEMQNHTRELIGGTIENIEVVEDNPLHPSDYTVIAEITVKTTKGKIVKVKKPKDVVYLL